jgi:hypothetical protein
MLPNNYNVVITGIAAAAVPAHTELAMPSLSPTMTQVSAPSLTF